MVSFSQLEVCPTLPSIHQGIPCAAITAAHIKAKSCLSSAQHKLPNSM